MKLDFLFAGWPDRVLYRGFEAASVSTGVLLPTERVSIEAILPTDDDGDDKNKKSEADGEGFLRKGQGGKHGEVGARGAVTARLPVWATMLIPDRPATPTPPKQNLQQAPLSPTASVIPALDPAPATATAPATDPAAAPATDPAADPAADPATAPAAAAATAAAAASAAVSAPATSAPVSPLQKFMNKVQSGSPKVRPSPVPPPVAPVVPKLNLTTKPPADPIAATKPAPKLTAPEPSVGWKAVEAKPQNPKVKVSVLVDDRTPQPGQLMERVKRLEHETAESERLEEVRCKTKSRTFEVW